MNSQTQPSKRRLGTSGLEGASLGWRVWPSGTPRKQQASELAQKAGSTETEKDSTLRNRQEIQTDGSGASS